MTFNPHGMGMVSLKHSRDLLPTPANSANTYKGDKEKGTWLFLDEPLTQES